MTKLLNKVLTKVDDYIICFELTNISDENLTSIRKGILIKLIHELFMKNKLQMV